jgi:hypothetical protein
MGTEANFSPIPQLCTPYSKNPARLTIYDKTDFTPRVQESTFDV